MKIVRFEDQNGAVTTARLGDDGQTYPIEGSLFGSYQVSETAVPVGKLLAPVTPVQIIGIGLNYREHARETNATVPEYPIVFQKTLNAVQSPGEPIVIPSKLASEEVDYECELAVVIGKSGRNISKENALSHVLGYTCANDVSARDWQTRRSGGQWGRAKSFDTFCPLGPVMVTADEITNPNSLPIRTIVSGEILQDWNTNDMIFDVPALIEFLSGDTTLLAGTVILTGTPQGVGMARKPPRWLKPGDTVTVEIDGIGKLTNPVVGA